MKTLVTAMIVTAMIVACGSATKDSTTTANGSTSTTTSNSSTGGSSTAQSNGSVTSGVNENGAHVMYLAENVILDTTTKVFASQIMLAADSDKKVGRLKSDNLELALANEVAPSLATSIKNRTWVATNKTSSVGFSGNGHITFTDNEIVLLDGRFAAGGMIDDNCGGTLVDPKYTYELIGNNHLIMTSEWNQMTYGQLAGVQQRQTILKISVEDQNTLIVVGHGLCGGSDDGITVLTAVVAE